MMLLASHLVSCGIASESSGSEWIRCCSIGDVCSFPHVGFLPTALASLMSPEVFLDIIKV